MNEIVRCLGVNEQAAYSAHNLPSLSVSSLIIITIKQDLTFTQWCGDSVTSSSMDGIAGTERLEHDSRIVGLLVPQKGRVDVSKRL